MAKEVERKFLVVGEQWRSGAQGVHCCQGYLNSAKERTVRVRLAGEHAWLTVKGPTCGISRSEYEYEIPVADAKAMLAELVEQPVIEKTRYRIAVNGLVWEVDEFLGVNAGLIVAEVELSSEDQVFEKPVWAGQEVSGDPRYFNSNLVARPYTTWPRTD